MIPNSVLNKINHLARLLGFRTEQDSELYSVSTECLTAVANEIQWLIDDVKLDGSKLSVSGWAINNFDKRAKDAEFLINGRLFEQVSYPLASPDLQSIYFNIPRAKKARFKCQTTVNKDDFRTGFLRLEFALQVAKGQARRKAWYYPDPELELSLPDESRIKRVIGVPNRTSYIVGGSTIFSRFEAYLKDKLQREYSDFQDVLDWGCGSARVSRYFHLFPQVNLVGVDIDKDNIDWCRKNLKHGSFFAIELSPPMEFSDNSFDLIISVSVLTHLNEIGQHLWLQELKRISRPNAILMLTIMGKSIMGLLQTEASTIESVESLGFKVLGHNPDLDDSIGKNDHYLNVMHSHDYIRKEWGRYFTVVDIVPALAANQDTVVLINNK